ncbi:Hypothetical_protein [Hexamita inflata]|uniref:Hypothetical_protein n=1 Tax=Hexamita inflata TaxID=28002 RepID=A0AA86U6X4_9EUKA|nr:Hypothetical protein HINF_LOCUS27767 [Hexamita inflata]
MLRDALYSQSGAQRLESSKVQEELQERNEQVRLLEEQLRQLEEETRAEKTKAGLEAQSAAERLEAALLFAAEKEAALSELALKAQSTEAERDAAQTKLQEAESQLLAEMAENESNIEQLAALQSAADELRAALSAKEADAEAPSHQLRAAETRLEEEKQHQLLSAAASSQMLEVQKESHPGSSEQRKTRLWTGERLTVAIFAKRKPNWSNSPSAQRQQEEAQMLRDALQPGGAQRLSSKGPGRLRKTNRSVCSKNSCQLKKAAHRKDQAGLSTKRRRTYRLRPAVRRRKGRSRNWPQGAIHRSEETPPRPSSEAESQLLAEMANESTSDNSPPCKRRRAENSEPPCAKADAEALSPAQSRGDPPRRKRNSTSCSRPPPPLRCQSTKKPSRSSEQRKNSPLDR